MTLMAKQAIREGLSPFRVHLADFLFTRFFPKSEDGDLFWFLIHLAEQAGNGHLRTDLGRIGEEAPLWITGDESLAARLRERREALVETGLEQGLIGRLNADAAAADSLPLPRPPLVLTADGSYLYFLRRRREEDSFLAMLSERTGTVSVTAGELSGGPAKVLAASIRSGKKLLLLSGGPGTGKTTTVARLLELLGPSLRVSLAAPTGRAASRMAENIPGHIGRTLHGLLGIIPGQQEWGAKYNSRNPLEADLVVVDEASMVDLPLMNALLRSLAPEAVLLLVGDPDQLPSVEAGALLGDLLAGVREAANAERVGPLSGSVVHLSKVYRSDTAVLNAAAAVRDGDMERFSAAVDGDSVSLKPLERIDGMAAVLADTYRRHTGARDVFTALTPLRRGLWGVPAMNERISRLVGGKSAPFAGMPIVVTRNDAARNLWNGDKAVLRDADGRLLAVFHDSDGERALPLAVLPGWEPAWIQTIHRSQGSEFDSIAVILPAGADRLLSREILYTALTRARHKVDIYAAEGALTTAMRNRVIRHSRIRRWAAGN